MSTVDTKPTPRNAMPRTRATLRPRGACLESGMPWSSSSSSSESSDALEARDERESSSFSEARELPNKRFPMVSRSL